MNTRALNSFYGTFLYVSEGVVTVGEKRISHSLEFIKLLFILKLLFSITSITKLLQNTILLILNHFQFVYHDYSPAVAKFGNSIVMHFILKLFIILIIKCLNRSW